MDSLFREFSSISQMSNNPNEIINSGEFNVMNLKINLQDCHISQVPTEQNVGTGKIVWDWEELLSSNPSRGSLSQVTCHAQAKGPHEVPLTIHISIGKGNCFTPSSTAQMCAKSNRILNLDLAPLSKG
jgi:hypothetical protein